MMTTHGLIPEGLTKTQEVKALAKLVSVSERTRVAGVQQGKGREAGLGLHHRPGETAGRSRLAKARQRRHVDGGRRVGACHCV